MNFPKTGLLYLRHAVLWFGITSILPGVASAQEAPKRCQYWLAQNLPIHFNGVRPSIEAGINGKPVKMLIDSGSFTTSLFQHAADRLGLTLTHSSFTTVGIGGESGTYLARLKEVKFGDSVGRHIEIPVITQYSEGIDADGVVGAKFLFQRSDMEMSLVGRYLKFYKANGCENTILSYWDHDAPMAPFRLGTEDDPRPEIDVTVNGKKLRALIDTGAPSSVIDLRAAEAVGVTPSSPGVVKSGHAASGIGKHATDEWIASFENISIGDETIKNARIEIADIWSGTRKDVKAFGLESWIREQPEMILGVDFLRSHRILFSLEQNYMYFSYLGGSVFRTSGQDDLSWFETAAAKGDVDSQLTLGLFYLHSPDVKRDAAKAFGFLNKAAEQGNNQARVELGRLYEAGEGVEQNFAKAIELYRKSAEEGEEAGQLSLARMYELGRGLDKDPGQALHWYRQAAQQGNAYAQARLGIAYMIGKDVRKDNELAGEWLDKAARDGKSPEYYRSLGSMLFNAGIYERSESAFQKAVDKSPGSEYAALWLYLVKTRFGKAEGAAQQLEENRAKWTKNRKWPTLIADFFLGRIKEDALMKLAHDSDKAVDGAQTCEANFYIAEWHLIGNERQEARPLLEAAAQSCPRDFIEYDAAVAELGRMSEK